MSSLDDVAARAHVHPDDVYELLVSVIGDGAEIDPAALPPGYADALVDHFDPRTRALAYPRYSAAADLAIEYRATRDPVLLDELRDRGHHRIIDPLLFEQPQPADPPTVTATRAQTRAHVDLWIAGAPPDPLAPTLSQYMLNSPTGG